MSKRETETELEDAPLSKRIHMEDLGAEGHAVFTEIVDIQEQLERIDDECVQAQLTIQKEFDKKKKPYLETRSEVIKKLPKFWSRALKNHSYFATCVDEDFKILDHLEGIDLEDNLDDHGSHKITFTFGEGAQEWLETLKLTKYLKYNQEGRELLIEVTPLKFKPGKDPREKVTEMRKKGHDDVWSIFEWFNDVVDDSSEDMESYHNVGEILRRHIWHTPHTYFAGMEEDDDEDGNYIQEDDEPLE